MLDYNFYKKYFYKSIAAKAVPIINQLGPYDRALHLECGDAVLSEFIQANEIHGVDDLTIESSAPIVKRLNAPDKVYDLIILSEKDYSTYSVEQIHTWIRQSCARLIAIVGTEEYIKYTNVEKFGRRIIHQDFDCVFLDVYVFDEANRLYGNDVIEMEELLKV